MSNPPSEQTLSDTVKVGAGISRYGASERAETQRAIERFNQQLREGTLSLPDIAEEDWLQ